MTTLTQREFKVWKAYLILCLVCTKAIGVQWLEILHWYIQLFILFQVKQLIHLDKSTSDLVSYCWIMYVRKQKDWQCSTCLLYFFVYYLLCCVCGPTFHLNRWVLLMLYVASARRFCVNICSNVTVQSGICP